MSETTAPADWPRTKSGALKHNHPVVFGRREAGCFRCDELAAGAPARALPYDSTKTRKAEEAQRCEEIRAHLAGEKHQSGGCGPVCTFGDW